MTFLRWARACPAVNGPAQFAVIILLVFAALYTTDRIDQYRDAATDANARVARVGAVAAAACAALTPEERDQRGIAVTCARALTHHPRVSTPTAATTDAVFVTQAAAVHDDGPPLGVFLVGAFGVVVLAGWAGWRNARRRGPP